MLNVTAAVIRNQDRVLICQKQSGKWEFPGGKIREGESFGQCLERELHEELGLVAKAGALLDTITHDYPGKSITLHFLEAKIISGVIILHEHKAFEWVSPKQLNQYDLSEADRRFVDIYFPVG